MLQRPPHIWSRAPRRSPLPGWHRDPLASGARSAAPAHGGARGEVGTFALPIRKWPCPAPDAAYPRGLPQSRRSVLEEALDPVPVAQDCQLVPENAAPAPSASPWHPVHRRRGRRVASRGVRSEAPPEAAQVQGPQATKRRSCPGLERALPSPLAAFHGSLGDGPGEKVPIHQGAEGQAGHQRDGPGGPPCADRAPAGGPAEPRLRTRAVTWGRVSRGGWRQAGLQTAPWGLCHMGTRRGWQGR